MNTTTIYSAAIKGIGTFRFAADLARAEVAICTEDAEGTWGPTQYQTADARHRKADALRLALRTAGREFFAEPGDKRDTDEILDDLLDGVAIAAVE